MDTPIFVWSYELTRISIYLMLSICLIKFSADDILKYFSDNLHEISRPIFWEKSKKNIVNLSSAEFARRAIKVKIGVRNNTIFFFFFFRRCMSKAITRPGVQHFYSKSFSKGKREKENVS